jgi:DNA-binding transcriptional ArsR family regulator
MLRGQSDIENEEMQMSQNAEQEIQYCEDEIEKVVTMFKALSDPTRLQVISVLTKNKQLCVSDIAELLKMSISRVSHHLSMLEKLGFTRHKHEGKKVYYSIDDDCILDIMARAKEHVRGQ